MGLLELVMQILYCCFLISQGVLSTVFLKLADQLTVHNLKM